MLRHPDPDCGSGPDCGVEKYIQDIVALLKTSFAPLLDMTYITASKHGLPEKVVHFFPWDHWHRRVPEEWRTFFEAKAALSTTENEDAWLQSLIDIQSARWALFTPTPSTEFPDKDIFHTDCPQSLIDVMKAVSRLLPSPKPAEGSELSALDLSEPLEAPEKPKIPKQQPPKKKKKKPALQVDRESIAALTEEEKKQMRLQRKEEKKERKLQARLRQEKEKEEAEKKKKAEEKEKKESQSKATTTEMSEGMRRKYNEGPMLAIESAGDATMCLMSQKKKYETRVLGSSVAKLAEETGCGSIVDIGAGKGYLTQWLQVHCKKGITALGVEGSDDFAESYRKRADVLQELTGNDGDDDNDACDDCEDESNKGDANMPNAGVIASRIPLGVDTSDFIKTLRKAGCNGDILLTGLHTCGDLAPTILSLFINSPDIKALEIVGCCYQSLTEEFPKSFLSSPVTAFGTKREIKYGFPLSNCLRHNSGLDFCIDTGRHLGSNVLPQFVSVEDFRHSSRMHCYRAAIESFLFNRVMTPGEDPQPHHMGNMRARYADGTFGEYAVRAISQMLKKLESYDRTSSDYKAKLRKSFEGVDLTENVGSPLETEANAFYETMHPTPSHLLPDVVCFAALRNMVGPLVEALVILDRLAFLRESLGDSLDTLYAIRRFCPDISPRSFAIVAVKK